MDAKREKVALGVHRGVRIEAGGEMDLNKMRRQTGFAVRCPTSLEQNVLAVSLHPKRHFEAGGWP